jgi:MFS family permease
VATVSAPPPRARAGAHLRVQRVQRRTIAVLVVGQVLGGVGIAVGFAVGALLARELSGSTELSGLAQTAGVLGAAVAAVPLARLAGLRGRRPSLAIGYGVGALGALLAVLAAAGGSFVLLLAGMVLFGSATAANLQARYAAVDLADPERRGRSLSGVVWRPRSAPWPGRTWPRRPVGPRTGSGCPRCPAPSSGPPSGSAWRRW